MDNIVIFGAGAHANVIIDIIEKSQKYVIVGIIDSILDIGSKFNDYLIIGRQENLKSIVDKHHIAGGVVAIGDNYARSILVQFISSLTPNFNFVNAIHPSVIIGKNVQIGVGNVIMPNVVLNTDAIIKNFCIINTNSSLEHNCVMHNFSSISAGVTTGGYVILGKYTAISLGVTLFDRIEIGEHTVVGSGSLVTKNIPPKCLFYGSPAKFIRSRYIGEKYLN